MKWKKLALKILYHACLFPTFLNSLRLGYDFGEIRGHIYEILNKERVKREMKLVDNNETLFLFAGRYDDSRDDSTFRVQFLFPFPHKGQYSFFKIN